MTVITAIVRAGTTADITMITTHIVIIVWDSSVTIVIIVTVAIAIVITVYNSTAATTIVTITVDEGSISLYWLIILS